MNLAEALRAEGCRVVEVAGWQTRGHAGYFKPVGGLKHHTGGRNDLHVVVNGRSDLPGPLGNLYLARDGVVHVVAAGVAWHAGAGSSVVLAEIKRAVPSKGDARARGLEDDYRQGNHDLFGVEVENDGREPLTKAQVEALPRLMAAACKFYGFKPNAWRHHREWTRRKVDMADRAHDFNAMCARQLGVSRAAAARAAAAAAARRAARRFRRNPYPAPPAQSYFRVGSKGTFVQFIQWAVGAKTDGSFGPLTERAVHAFQRKHGLVPDGVAGPKTLAQLKKVVRR